MFGCSLVTGCRPSVARKRKGLMWVFQKCWHQHFPRRCLWSCFEIRASAWGTVCKCVLQRDYEVVNPELSHTAHSRNTTKGHLHIPSHASSVSPAARRIIVSWIQPESGASYMDEPRPTVCPTASSCGPGTRINQLTINYVGQCVAVWEREKLSVPLWIWLWLNWPCSSRRSERGIAQRVLQHCCDCVGGGEGRSSALLWFIFFMEPCGFILYVRTWEAFKKIFIILPKVW